MNLTAYKFENLLLMLSRGCRNYCICFEKPRQGTLPLSNGLYSFVDNVLQCRLSEQVKGKYKCAHMCISFPLREEERSEINFWLKGKGAIKCLGKDDPKMKNQINCLSKDDPYTDQESDAEMTPPTR